MSSHATGRPNGRPPHQHHSKSDEPQWYDAQVGTWPREQLERMNERFADRLERAVRSGNVDAWWERKRDHPCG